VVFYFIVGIIYRKLEVVTKFFRKYHYEAKIN